MQRDFDEQAIPRRMLPQFAQFAAEFAAARQRLAAADTALEQAMRRRAERRGIIAPAADLRCAS